MQAIQHELNAAIAARNVARAALLEGGDKARREYEKVDKDVAYHEQRLEAARELEAANACAEAEVKRAEDSKALDVLLAKLGQWDAKTEPLVIEAVQHLEAIAVTMQKVLEMAIAHDASANTARDLARTLGRSDAVIPDSSFFFISRRVSENAKHRFAEIGVQTLDFARTIYGLVAGY